MPKISVIVPAYNTQVFLRRCLDSIINQTFKDFEIIAINDGSLDDSKKVLKEYQDRYPGIVHFFDKENTGLADTRNFGISKANGEYVCFVDSDDYIEKDLLENLSKYFGNDLVKYKLKIVDDKKNIKIDGPIFENLNGEEAFEKLCFKDIIMESPCIYMYNLKFLRKNKFKFLPNAYHEDFGLIPLIIITAKKVSSVDVYGYNYVQVDNSIVRNDDYEKTLKRANDLLVHYNNAKKFVENRKFSKNTVENIKRYYSNAIFNRCEKLKPKEKKIYVKEIRKRKLIKNIKPRNIRQLCKKIKIYMFLLFN